jgi:ferredoxin
VHIVSCPPSYRVELLNRANRVVEVAADRPILEAVEEAGLTLPYGCRYGACMTCAARLVDGRVDQSEGVALKPAQLAMGYILLCVARPLSDCKVEVGYESQRRLYVNPFKGSP